MVAKKFIPVFLTGLLFASQPVLSEEQPVVQPEQGDVAAVVTVEAVDPGQVQETAAPAGGMATEGPGMTMDEQGGADKSGGMAMRPGMMGGGKGCRMNKGGMKGMMPGGMDAWAAWAQAARRAAVWAAPGSRINSTAS